MRRIIKRNGAMLFAVSANVTTSLRKLRSINGRYDYALITFYTLYHKNGRNGNGKASKKLHRDACDFSQI